MTTRSKSKKNASRSKKDKSVEEKRSRRGSIRRTSNVKKRGSSEKASQEQKKRRSKRNTRDPSTEEATTDMTLERTSEEIPPKASKDKDRSTISSEHVFFRPVPNLYFNQPECNMSMSRSESTARQLSSSLSRATKSRQRNLPMSGSIHPPPQDKKDSHQSSLPSQLGSS